MPCPPAGRHLLWALLLLLPGLQPPSAHTWCSEEDMDSYNLQAREPDFLPAVKLAEHAFNRQTGDQHAYRLLRILSSSRLPGNAPAIFSMKLSLGRTVCKKFEFDIDHCPFQQGKELNNTFICLFTVRAPHLGAPAGILTKTCSQGPP